VAGQAAEHEPLIPRPGLTLPEIREAVATVVPGRLAEMFTKMQDAFTKAGEQNSVVQILRRNVLSDRQASGALIRATPGTGVNLGGFPRVMHERVRALREESHAADEHGGHRP
jgi:hypothetical protein